MGIEPRNARLARSQPRGSRYQSVKWHAGPTCCEPRDSPQRTEPYGRGHSLGTISSGVSFCMELTRVETGRGGRGGTRPPQ